MAKTFQVKPKTELSKGYVQTILDDLGSSFKIFKDGHEQIIEIVRENSIAENNVPYLSTDTFYKCYDLNISVKANLLDLIFGFYSPQTSTDHASSTFHANSLNETFCAEARLPKIDLPKHWYIIIIPSQKCKNIST